jgi:rhodanese-related sulfurtransferase
MRRHLLLGGGVVVLSVTVLGLTWPGLFYDALTEERAGAIVDAQEAFRLAQAGEIVLVDIRRPDEWERTGRPAGSFALDMRRDDFEDALAEIVGGDRSAPIALICARGVRSARMANRLIAAGFENVEDVPEGMLGSSAGPGWLSRGLPLEEAP